MRIITLSVEDDFYLELLDFLEGNRDFVEIVEDVEIQSEALDREDDC
ncbi:MAG: hypothetical protein PHO62_08050 [Sulfurimonas sp.]|nr:hypothetical protein [Sulfurimonas sp.]MDD5373360.1 hypothetical protein [Sulfurimonas sp.]